MTSRELLLLLARIVAAAIVFAGFAWWARRTRFELQGPERGWLMLAAAAPFFIGLLVLSGRRLRHPSQKLRITWRWVVVPLALYVVIYGGATGANSLLDTSKPFQTEWLVRDVIEAEPPLLSLVRESDDRSKVAIEVSEELAASAVPGFSRVVITSHKGALGWLRIVDVQAQPLPEGFDAAHARLAHVAGKAAKRGRSDSMPGLPWVLAFLGAIVAAIPVTVAMRARALARRLGASWRLFSVAGVHGHLEYRISEAACASNHLRQPG